MQRKTLILVVAIFILIGASVAYLLITRSSPSSDKKPVDLQQQDTTKKRPSPPAPDTSNTGSTTTVKGEYLVYSEQSYTAKKATTRLIFFHAQWCPQCRQLDEDIKKSAIPNDVTIFKVDYDSSQELRQKYDVTLQTTIVRVDQDGNKLASIVAYENPTFQTIKDKLL